MELMLTSHFFLFADKAWGGMTTSNAKDLEWFIPRKKMKMASLISPLLDTGGVQLDSMEPRHPQYSKLRGNREDLDGMVEKVKWDKLRSEGKKFIPGDTTTLMGENGKSPC